MVDIYSPFLPVFLSFSLWSVGTCQRHYDFLRLKTLVAWWGLIHLAYRSGEAQKVMKLLPYGEIVRRLVLVLPMGLRGSYEEDMHGVRTKKFAKGAAKRLTASHCESQVYNILFVSLFKISHSFTLTHTPRKATAFEACP